MSGDFSRWSFQSWRDFSAVLMQQGRVHTDADWNEWVSIVLRRLEAEAIDSLGRAVVPLETPDGFRIQLPTPTTLTIGTGRAYVDGLLAENHGNPRDTWYAPLAELRGLTPTPFTQQPYYPGAALPAAGAFVAYLKVWQRELTAIEAPDLIEKALGVDTTGRYQTVWQVKLAPAAAGQTCLTPLESNPAFVTAEPPAGGRMTTGTATVTVDPDPCLVPPGGGYSGIENQLYRVEIHRGGGIGGAAGATFKWSRDDASVATRVTEIPATMDRIVVDDVGRDDVLSLHDGEWIELTDDWLELNGQPGQMCQIAFGGGVDRATKTVILRAPLPAGVFPVDGQGRTLPERNTRLRRWDQGGIVRDGGGTKIDDLEKATSTGTIAVPTGQKTVLLEHNIVVSFDVKPAGGVFRTGDHWVFAARTADASAEKLDHAPPRAIHAHFAPLALVTIPGGVTDCRTVFPPLGGLDALEYVAGDGQEVTPGIRSTLSRSHSRSTRPPAWPAVRSRSPAERSVSRSSPEPERSAAARGRWTSSPTQRVWPRSRGRSTPRRRSSGWRHGYSMPPGCRRRSRCATALDCGPPTPSHTTRARPTAPISSVSPTSRMRSTDSVRAAIMAIAVSRLAQPASSRSSMRGPFGPSRDGTRDTSVCASCRSATVSRSARSADFGRCRSVGTAPSWSSPSHST